MLPPCQGAPRGRALPSCHSRRGRPRDKRRRGLADAGPRATVRAGLRTVDGNELPGPLARVNARGRGFRDSSSSRSRLRMSGAPQEGLEPRGPPAAGKACLTTMDTKLNVLNEKVDKLLHFQEDVTEKLQCVCQGLGHLEQGLHRLEARQVPGPAGAARTPAAAAQAGWPEVLELVRAVRQEAAQHGARLEALLGMLVAVDKVVAVVGAVFQNSKVVDFIMQGSVPWRKGSLADGPVEVGVPRPSPLSPPSPGAAGTAGLPGTPGTAGLRCGGVLCPPGPPAPAARGVPGQVPGRPLFPGRERQWPWGPWALGRFRSGRTRAAREGSTVKRTHSRDFCWFLCPFTPGGGSSGSPSAQRSPLPVPVPLPSPTLGCVPEWARRRTCSCRLEAEC